MEHFHEKIHGFFNCANLYRRMVEEAQNGSVFVELGVFKGKSAAYMGVEILNSKKKIEFYAVDHFLGSPEHVNDPAVKDNKLKEECYLNLTPVMGVVRMLPVASHTAAAMFADESIDFIYIDAAHEYDAVKADIQAWLPKVKVGGVFAGDDYGIPNHPDVKKVVDEFFPNAEHEGWVWWIKK